MLLSFSCFCVFVKSNAPFIRSNIPVVIIKVFIKLGVKNEELIKTKKLETKVKIVAAIMISFLSLNVKLERMALANGFIIMKYKPWLFIEILCTLFYLRFLDVFFLDGLPTSYIILVKEKKLQF